MSSWPRDCICPEGAASRGQARWVLCHGWSSPATSAMGCRCSSKAGAVARRQAGKSWPLLDPLPANLVVHRYLPDLRLRDPRLLDRLPEPALQEAVEVLARVPHVDDREAVVGGAGGMERLTFP